MLLWFATWVARRERRDPKAEGTGVAPAELETALPGGR